MMRLDDKPIGICGLGLIGGSMAKALKQNGVDRVLGYDLSPQVMGEALGCGAIDGELSGGRLGECGLLFAALYPGDTIDYLLQNLSVIRPGAVVVDLCGVKQVIHSALEEPCLSRGIHFIGGHPMAGREYSGFAYASAELFRGGSFILTPPANTSRKLLDELKELLLKLGFGQVMESSPEQHDRIIAHTSQLAHILSGSYMKSPTARLYKGFSAGSFHDLTRVARANEIMWSELFLHNRAPLLHELDRLIDELGRYRLALSDGNEELLRRLIAEGSNLRDEIIG